MRDEFTAIVQHEDDWWIGWIEEVPGVNCQERTREALCESLRLALYTALDLERQGAFSGGGKASG